MLFTLQNVYSQNSFQISFWALAPGLKSQYSSYLRGQFLVFRSLYSKGKEGTDSERLNGKEDEKEREMSEW